jgi:glycosyltransferase involved in cell wall biosynthesis
MDWQNRIKDKKIVLFSAETVPSSAGFGVNAFNFASALNTFGAKTQVVCYNYNNKSINHESIEHVSITRLAYYNKNIFAKIFSFPYLILNYFKYVRKCDVVFIYGKYLVGYELILLFSLIHKKITIFRSTLLGDDDLESIHRQSKILWPFRRLLFSKTSCYFSINSSFSSIWKNYFPGKPKIFESPQGVNIQRFFPEISKNNNVGILPGIPENHIVFFSCGIVVERKGYREIFDALKNLEYPFVYIIAGQYSSSTEHKSSKKELEEMQSLYSYGKQLLKEKLIFTGVTTNVEKYLNSSDFFIHGAVAEGTPNAVLEAMACGIPIICRKTDGISGEILKANENYLEYSNIKELISHLKSLPFRKNELNNLAKSALQTIRENYTFELVIQRLFKCLEKTKE